MANRYTIADNTWDGDASVPIEGDRVLIKHRINLASGTTTWGDDSTSTISIDGVSTTRSINIASGGHLYFPRDASSELVCKGSIYVYPGGRLNIGTAADPIPAAYTSLLSLNKSAVMAASKYALTVDKGAYLGAYGATQRRIATLTSPAAVSDTTIYVSDAAGWKAGDELYIPNVSSTGAIVTRVIDASYISESLTVPLTSALALAYPTDCPVAHVTSNVNIGNYNKTYPSYAALIVSGTSVANSFEIGYCTTDLGGNVYPHYSLSLYQDANYGAFGYTNPFSNVESLCCIARTNTTPINIGGMTGLEDNPVFNDAAFLCLSTGPALADASTFVYNGCLAAGTFVSTTMGSSVGATFNGGWFSGRHYGGGRRYKLNDLTFTGATGGNRSPMYYGVAPGSVDTTYARCNFNALTYESNVPLATIASYGTDLSVILKDCFLNVAESSDASLRNLTDSSYIKIVNRNADVTLQELLVRRGYIKRDNSEVFRGTSSAKMKPSTVSMPLTYSFNVAVADGETVHLIGYCKYDAAYYNSGVGFVSPTMTLSGTINGTTLTPVVYTAASANAGEWDAIDASITNTAGAAGEVTVTYSIQSANVAGLVWWDGIADAPMVVSCRHYGYVFDETNPKRQINITTSASEGVAATYTGIAVTWGSSSSSVAITSSTTLQKLYDYTQAHACLNRSSALPLTGVGVSGSPSLFVAGDITVSDGAVLNGNGSLSMGAFTILATEFSSGLDYTYTGGTWGQLSNSPSFAGGTLNIGAAATYSFATTGDIVINMTPSAPSTYALASVTATGELDLRNSTAHAITVELSSEAASLAITSNNTGGAITISAPQLYQSVPISNITATSRVQIYDESASAPAGSRELYNGIPGATSYTWTDALPAVATRDIRVRITNVVGATAKVMIESSIGTCGVTEETKSVSYRATQVNDAVYIANAIDGSSVTDITIDDTDNVVRIAISGGGSKSWPQIYAYQVYWLNTEVGIRDDFAFIVAPDTANYRLTNFKIRNDDASPLVLTSGYGVDATTGNYIDAIDTAGSTGNIFPDVAHVVPKVITVGGVNVITGDIADIPAAPSAVSIADAVWNKTLP